MQLEGPPDSSQVALDAHLADDTDAHDASAISVVPFDTIEATNVQDALEEVLAEAAGGGGVTDHGALTGLGDDDHPQYTLTAEAAALADAAQAAAEATAAAALAAHTGDAADAHDASAISILDAAADFTATDVEGALAELQADAETDEAALSAHIGDLSDAHDASAVSVVPFGSIAATDVQAALEEIVAEASGGVTDHGALTGLADDDHTQYHTDARGDARYWPLSTDLATQAELDAHLSDAADAHDASAISILDTAADFTATDVEGALAELQADAEADDAALAAHLADTTDAHDASSISVEDTGGNFTGTDVETVLAELASGLGGGATSIAARVHNSSAQAVADSTAVALSFDSERYDVGGLHSAGQPTRLTAPEDGIYSIGAAIEYDDLDTDGLRLLDLSVNGGASIGEHWANAVVGSVTRLAIHVEYELAQGDYVECFAFQDSGSTLDVNVTGNLSPEFWMHKIAAVAPGNAADAVSITDAKGNYTGTDVEAALEEAATRRVQIKVISDTTVLTTGDGKTSFFIDSSLNGMNLTAVAAAVVGTSSSGTPTVQLRRVRAGSPADMLSTKITIDAGDLNSYDGTPAVIDSSNDDVVTGDRIFIDVDVAGTGTDGLDVVMVFARP